MGRTAGTRQLLATAATCQHHLPFPPSSRPAQHHPASASALFRHPVVSSSYCPLLWPVPSHQRMSYQLRLWCQQHPTASKGNGMEKGGEGMGSDFLSGHDLHFLVGNTAENTKGSPGNTETEEFTWLHTNISGGVLASEPQRTHLLNRTGNILGVISFSLGFAGIGSSIAKRQFCLARLIDGFANGLGDGRDLLQRLLRCGLVIIHPLIEV